MKSSFLIQRKNGLAWLIAPHFVQFPWLLHGFSTRIRGASKSSLDLGTARGRPTPGILRNRRAFLEALGASDFALASVHQIHSAEILRVTRSGNLQYRPAALADGAVSPSCGDALLTRDARALLSIRAADCLPLLIVDPKIRAIAAVHAGWRGLLARIVEKTAGEMRRAFGSNPKRLFAALGPCIGPCCYEVGEEVVDAFTGRFIRSRQYFCKIRDAGKRGFPGMPFLSMAPPGHAPAMGSGLALDLAAAAADQLRTAGLPASHIEACGLCTSCRNDLFFSYRKEGAAAGRMMAVIGIREAS